MLESIINNLKGQVGNDLMSKAGLNVNQIDKVMDVSGDAAKETFMSKLSPDNIGSMMNLFSNNANNNQADSMQQEFSTNLVSGLISKVGLSKPIADTVSGIIVPKLIGLITNKNSETPDDDSSSIMGMFGGSGNDMLGGLTKNIGKFF